MMHLEELSNDHLDLASDWMSRKENYQWLDFGAGRQVLSRSAIALMRSRDLHVLRLFAPAAGERPVGIVALSNVAETFGSATLWYVLGDKGRQGRGHTTRAVAAMLDLAFGPLGLRSVNAWAVAGNAGSIKVLERNRFTLLGIQRCCHVIDGEERDRLLFDLLPEDREP